MNTSVIYKAGYIPTELEVAVGQIAINSNDGILYTQTIDGTVKALNDDPNAIHTLNGKTPTGSTQEVNLIPSDIGAAPVVSGKIPETYFPLSVLGANINLGSWDASTNTPSISLRPALDQVGNFYEVTVAGTQFGINWIVGDLIMGMGDATGIVTNYKWVKVKTASDVQKVNNVAPVAGAVTLAATDITTGVFAAAQLATGSPTSGQVVSYNGTGTAWVNAASGSVTSVDLAAGEPNVLAISGGPITSSGTITVGFKATTAGTFLSGTGDDKPVFKAIAYDDVGGIRVPKRSHSIKNDATTDNATIVVNATDSVTFINNIPTTPPTPANSFNTNITLPDVASLVDGQEITICLTNNNANVSFGPLNTYTFPNIVFDTPATQTVFLGTYMLTLMYVKDGTADEMWFIA